MIKKKSKHFDFFLENYYLFSQIEEIKKLLNSLRIYQAIADIINDFYAENPDQNTFDARLTLTIGDFVFAVNTSLKEVKVKEIKYQYQIRLVELGVYLIKETYNISKYSKEKYFRILKSTLQNVYKRNKWNLDELNQLLNLENIEKYTSNNQLVLKPKSEVKLNTICLEWLGKDPIDFFINDVRKYFKLKNDNLRYLFQSVISDYYIAIHPSRLTFVLILFSSLHERGIIRVKGGRGIFVLLERYLKPSVGTFPQRDFRKIKYDTVKNAAQSTEIKSTMLLHFGSYFESGR